jgi:hypothetical protein
MRNNDHSLIHDLINENQNVETPRSWGYWSILAAVSACAKNYSLVTLKGNLVYYPNIYVMLLGESTWQRLSELTMQNDLSEVTLLYWDAHRYGHC